ncbi:MAG: galactokinase, partial [Treponema sp.]|nr:galactokinase [Treponema sp.]
MNCKELQEYISAGKLDEKLKELYVDDSLLGEQKKRYLACVASFEKTFGADGSIGIYSAPGRSEVCGNHTDHQHGMCVAASINLDVVAVARPRSDGVVNVLSEGYDMITVDSAELKYSQAEQSSTKALIKGVLKGMKEEGFEVGGFDCYLTSNVIVGAGLSSSAAFENALGTVVNHLYNGGKINAIDTAKASKFAENVYFGKPCGLLDQMASSVGGLIQIDFKDVENPLVKKIDVDFSAFGYSLCIVDVHASHADLTPDYAAIPQEMKSVAEFFGQTHLRNVNPEDFYANLAKVRAACSDRALLRAYHFFEEEENVQNLVKKLEQKDFPGFLHFVKASGNSSYKFLQNIYSLKNPENQSVSIALAFSQKYLETQKGSKDSKGVCRVHGGGFAGTIQAFVKDQYVSEYKHN